MHQELETIGWNEMYIKQMDMFSIKKIYKALRGEYQKREARGWDEEVLWANTHCKGKQARAKERNQHIFKQIIRTPGMLVRKIVQEVHLRGRKWTS
ncbi:hypothetical protein KY290_008268 [Solanum tuberosum]|uniref:Uncharacterized protein n=1 Tax=Solanum tuberosum TaxID=4113 RepID=A0ABQ7W7Y4_SOLTU|nr:hypothetical protein KY290_008263 [Solanum tuberosum]KAH0776857.1 hypothetical protein KY290_008268 [Solanum tuberosum]